MEHSSPVAKIVATATSSAWAQSYSAGKLHVALSLKGEPEEPIASSGKELLEKLQREFFALDEKTLSNLKKTVETVVKTIPEGIEYSLVLTTIVQDVLYIVIANSGTVLLKRKGHISIVGSGEANKIVGYSGKLLPNDIILVGTEGLFSTIPPKNIEHALRSETPNEISENLAPLLHDNESGTEAALVWSMLGETKTTIPQDVLEAEEKNDELDLSEPTTKVFKINLSGITGFFKTVPTHIRKLSRKQLIIAAAVVLIIILGFSLFAEKNNRDNKKQTQEAQSIIEPNRQKYDDAVALMSLNKSLAIEELNEIKDSIEKAQEKFPAGSSARQQLDSFLSQVNSALSGEETTTSKINVFFDASKDSDIKNVSTITTKGGQIAIVGNSKGGLLTSDGKIDSTFNGADSVHGITADEKNIYVLAGSSVEQITKSTGKTATIIEKQASPISIDDFGGNIYLLSASDKTVYKYRPTSYAKESYFTGNTKLSSPTSFSIDASVYVIDNGTIKKFTRGAIDSFNYKGKQLSPKSQIYTDEDYTNLYILDPEKKTATIVDKSGNPSTEISLRGMKDITSIAANEKDHKMYVVADNKVYSIDY